MIPDCSDDELLAYLDEELPVELSADIEGALRSSPELSSRLAELIRQRDHGMHSVGEIWRRLRLSCPSRTELGRFMIGAMTADEQAYIRFHLDDIGCRVCEANLEDLRQSIEEIEPLETTAARRQRYFESSAGFLRSRNS